MKAQPALLQVDRAGWPFVPLYCDQIYELDTVGR
jgi:hypothetical protein